MLGDGSTFAARSEVLKNLIIPKEVNTLVDELLVLYTLNLGYSFFIEKPLTLHRRHEASDSNAKNADMAKLKRLYESQEAILSIILEGDFQRDIKNLYLLKTKVAGLALKETLECKSFNDVIDMWLLILSNVALFKQISLR